MLLRFLTAVALLLAPASSAFGAIEEMVKSKPVLINGLEFVAATESNWIVYRTSLGEDPVEIQLWITNRTKTDLVFSVFDTFSVVVTDTAGHEVTCGGGRDATLRTKPVLIRAGDTYCLSRSAKLAWGHDDKTERDLSYTDGTGSWYHWKLILGPYRLRFNVDCTGLDSETKFFAKIEGTPLPSDTVWTGKGVTGDVPFAVVDPPQK